MMLKRTPKFPFLVASLLCLTAPLSACGSDKETTAASNPPVGTERQQVAAATTAQTATPANTKMAATPGTVVRATELKDKPAVEAKTLKKLVPQTTLSVLDRQGGWLRVSAQGQQGWVRLLHVSTQPPGARAGSAQDIDAAKRIATGRAGSGNIVATSGIRGLNEEQLRTAAANPEELKKLDSYTATDAQASDYARKQGLAPRRVDYPAAPK